jgi:hypothetical protein
MKWHALFGTSALVAYPIWQDPSWWRWTASIFGDRGAGRLLLGRRAAGDRDAGVRLSLAWLATWVYSLRA